MNDRVIKYFKNELSETERIQLLEEAHSNSKLKNEMASFQNLQAIISLTPEMVDINEGKIELNRLKESTRHKKLKYYIRTAIGHAAAIAVIIAATWMITISIQKLEIQHLSAAQQELYVPAGQRARITLPDGTLVWLNSRTSLKYPSVFDKERKIYLSGEAYFNVAKDKKKPFIVSTHLVDIMALGTEFNVCSHLETSHMSATLITGSIKIYEPQAKDKSIVLVPNQQLTYENGVFRVETLKDKDDLLWKNGIYNFKSARLDTILKKLELDYDTKIIVKDPEILSYLYTGKFRQQDGVGEILRIIQQIHPFKIAYNEEQNQIILSK